MLNCFLLWKLIAAMFFGDPNLRWRKGDAERELHRRCPPEPAECLASRRLRLFVKPWHFPTGTLKTETKNPTPINLNEGSDDLVTKKYQRNQMPDRRAVTFFL